MKLQDDHIDALVAGLATVHDDDVDALDEALFERIIATPATVPAKRRRYRRPRIAVLAGIGAILVAGGAAASLLFDSERQATAEVECFQSASPGDRSVAQEPVDGRDPVAVCHDVLAAGGRPVPPLVACAGDGTVAVIPGRTSSACGDAGLKVLSSDYSRQRTRVARLQRDLLRLEADVDCLPPAEFAVRVQQLLDRSGWAGWTTRLRDARGPCGVVTMRGGGTRRILGAGIDGAKRVVWIRSEWSHSVDKLLYDPRDGVLYSLRRRSAASCYSTRELKALVDRTLAAHGLRTRLDTTQPAVSGCAVLSLLQPDADGTVIVTVIPQETG